MSFVNKEYLKTQFTNFSVRLTQVFAKKNDIPTKTSELENDSGYKTTDNNTTYTFANGVIKNTFTITPSDGTIQTITINCVPKWN